MLVFCNGLPSKSSDGLLTQVSQSSKRFYGKRARGKEKGLLSKKASFPNYAALDFPPELVDMASYKKELESEMERLKDHFVTQLSLRVDTRAYETLSVKLEDGSIRSLIQLGKIKA